MEEVKMEMLEHEVIIDDNILVKLKIPKILTAMELKALSIKADKMFKISEVTMPKSAGRKPSGIAMFTEEMTNDIMQLRDTKHLGYDEIARRINKKYDTKISRSSIQSRYYNTKDRLKNGE